MSCPTFRVLLPVLALTLVACGEPPTVDAEIVSRPVKTMLVGDVQTSGVRLFPARIDAGRKAQLAFRVPGTLQQLPVKEGDLVEEGQVVAALDKTDYQLVVNERRTTFENARKNFERGQELVGKGAISKVDFDKLEAEFRNTRTALEAAQQDLSYTELKAPFAGSVARRYVENFEAVQAKQTLLDLQDTAQLDVSFDVPERLVRGLRRGACDGQQARDAAVVTATFDGAPGASFPLAFREVATKADGATQTFEVTYSMERNDRLTILPGMTANVTLDMSACVSDDGGAIRIPVGAVTADSDLGSRVWVVDEQAKTVSARSVTTGALQGDSIEVLEGLQPGTRIVVAGAAFLAEAMPITLLPQTEQAAPRPAE
jgi:RND family efflux transporter MFP subunit